MRAAFEGVGCAGARGPTSARRPISPARAAMSWSPRARPRASRCATCCPALHAIETRRGPKGQRGASVLYLSPTKALAQDQLSALRATRPARPALRHPRRRLHAGDARVDPRPRRVRAHQPRHAAPLAAARARPLVALLRVLDATSSSTSATTTAALFGAHVAQSCAACAGSRRSTAPTPRSCSPRPRWPSPRRPSGRLIGLDVAAVTEDGSPRGRAVLALWEPPFVAGVGEQRRSRAPLGHQRGRRPADRPRRGRAAHPGVRPVAARGRGGRPSRAPPARRGRPDPGRPGRGLPRRLPARGASRARGGAALGPAARAGRHERPRAGHRHHRARRRAAGRLPGHAGVVVAAGGPGRPQRARRPGACWSRATTRWTPTWCTTPRPCSASRSRPTSSTRTTRTSSARTCARPPRSGR